MGAVFEDAHKDRVCVCVHRGGGVRALRVSTFYRVIKKCVCGGELMKPSER